MKNEVVRVHNDVNKISLKKLSPVEIDLFWTIASKTKDIGDRTVELKYSDVKKLAHWNNRNRSTKEFEQDLGNMFSKIMSMPCWIIDEEGTNTLFTLFQEFKYGGVLGDIIKVTVSEGFTYLFNDLLFYGNFTRFELENLVNIQSKYVKEIYRYIMQFRSTGFWKIRIEDFREKLGVPSTYKMANIDQKILNLAKRELTKKDKLGNQILEYLTIEKIKKGRSVSHLYFHFKVAEQKVLSKEEVKEFQTERREEWRSEIRYDFSSKKDEYEREAAFVRTMNPEMSEEQVKYLVDKHFYYKELEKTMPKFKKK